MRVYKTRWFACFARGEHIADDRLADAIAGAERDLVDADLGGGLIKQRVTRPGQGKRGGWRTLVVYRRGQRAVFMFGFAKSDLDNIGPDRESDLKAAARDLLTLSESEIAKQLAAQALVEVPYGQEED